MYSAKTVAGPSVDEILADKGHLFWDVLVDTYRSPSYEMLINDQEHPAWRRICDLYRQAQR